VRNADYKFTEGLAKSERSEDFGADRVLGHEGSPTDVGDEENCHGWLFSDASRRERSELGEINTLGHVMTATEIIAIQQHSDDRRAEVLPPAPEMRTKVSEVVEAFLRYRAEALEGELQGLSPTLKGLIDARSCDGTWARFSKLKEFSLLALGVRPPNSPDINGVNIGLRGVSYQEVTGQQRYIPYAEMLSGLMAEVRELRSSNITSVSQLSEAIFLSVFPQRNAAEPLSSSLVEITSGSPVRLQDYCKEVSNEVRGEALFTSRGIFLKQGTHHTLLEYSEPVFNQVQDVVRSLGSEIRRGTPDDSFLSKSRVRELLSELSKDLYAEIPPVNVSKRDSSTDIFNRLLFQRFGVHSYPPGSTKRGTFTTFSVSDLAVVTKALSQIEFTCLRRATHVAKRVDLDHVVGKRDSGIERLNASVTSILDRRVSSLMSDPLSKAAQLPGIRQQEIVFDTALLEGLRSDFDRFVPVFRLSTLANVFRALTALERSSLTDICAREVMGGVADHNLGLFKFFAANSIEYERAGKEGCFPRMSEELLSCLETIFYIDQTRSLTRFKSQNVRFHGNRLPSPESTK
jgi:hypothetical protein